MAGSVSDEAIFYSALVGGGFVCMAAGKRLSTSFQEQSCSSPATAYPNINCY